MAFGWAIMGAERRTRFTVRVGFRTVRFLVARLPEPPLARGLVLFGLAVGMFLGVRTGIDSPGVAGAATAFADLRAKAGPTLLLGGPNDGEPARTGIARLPMATNCSDGGALTVSVDGLLIYSTPLHRVESRFDGQLYHSVVELKVSELERRLNVSLRDPDARPITVRVDLLRGPLGLTVLTASWTGRLIGPWLEDLAPAEEEGAPNPGAAELGAMDAPAETSTFLVHADPLASFYFVFGSRNRADVLLSPENPATYARVRVLSGGPLDGERREEIEIDSVQASQYFLVLWTFRSDIGWTRSEVYSVGADLAER